MPVKRPSSTVSQDPAEDSTAAPRDAERMAGVEIVADVDLKT